MSYKVFDFECASRFCILSYERKEIMVNNDEKTFCEACGGVMTKVATATRAKGRISTYSPFKAGMRKERRLRNVFKKIDDND